MKYSMLLHDAPFKQIKAGKKTVEARLYDRKRQEFKLGYLITLTNRANEKDTVTVEIIGLSRFSTFETMFNSIDITYFGYSPETSPTHAVESMRKYYSIGEEIMHGVLGIHIRLQI